MRPRVIVVGARRRRQGIGPYVARSLQRAGAEVCAVVGSSEATAGGAAADLAKLGVPTAAPYVDLDEAIAREGANLAVVCTPNQTHRAFALQSARRGVNCLCDKPLWWNDSDMSGGSIESETAAIVDAFVERGLLLDTLTQWPAAWPAYHTLYPDARTAIVESFRMILSPIDFGPSMVPDALPHALSLLWARVGPGSVEEAEARFDAARRALHIAFAYRHAGGSVAVSCEFTACETQPRPAAFGVNGQMAHRVIDMPSYTMRLVGDDGREAPLPDPLDAFLQAFLDRLDSRAETERSRLIASMTNLWPVYDAAQRAGGGGGAT